jgi:hypothetical protein
MTDAEFAKTLELQCEFILVQIIEQRGLQAPDHRVDDMMSFFLRRQRQSDPNLLGQLASTSCTCSHLVQIPF